VVREHEPVRPRDPRSFYGWLLRHGS
jgi:hypothetical protein